MFYELLKTRRSIRKYQDIPLEREKLDTILKAALLSPSSRSIRPWEFVTVTDKALLDKLSQFKSSAGFIKDAAAAVVVIGEPVASDAWIEDASIASIFIQLAAHALGIGSCWIQVRGRPHSESITAEDYIKELLGIPGECAVEAVISLGYPAEEKKAYDDGDLLYDKLHYETY
ncbi:MAG: nitroreductase family protein [Bacillota bacterium]